MVYMVCNFRNGKNNTGYESMIEDKDSFATRPPKKAFSLAYLIKLFREEKFWKVSQIRPSTSCLRKNMKGRGTKIERRTDLKSLRGFP